MKKEICSSVDIDGIENYKLLWYLLREYDSSNFVSNISNLERKMFELSNDFDKEMLYFR